jgi:ABC-type lipoprotein release transport system permease subunit
VVAAGRRPAVGGTDAVVVNEEAARMLGWKVGTRHSFETVPRDRMFEWFTNDAEFTSTEALEGPRVEVEVAAVVRHEADLNDSGYPGMVFPEGFARAHADEIAHVEPFVLIRADPTRVDAVRRRVESIVGPVGMDVVDAPPLGEAAPAVIPTVRVEVTTLGIAAIVAAAAGLFVVAQAVGRQLGSTVGEDRVRAALGMTSRQQAIGKWLAVAPAVVVGAAAVPIVAWALSGMLPRGLARRVDPSSGLRFESTPVLIGTAATAIAVLVLVAAVAAFGPRHRRIQPSLGAAPSGRLLGRPALTLGASFATDPTGSGRSRAGTWAAVATVALAIAALLTVATLDGSRRNLLSSPRLYGAPAALRYESNGTVGVAAVVAQATATPGVSAVTRQLMINDDTMPASGTRQAEVEPEALEVLLGGALPPVRDGRHPQGPDEVALGAATAEDLGVDVGDSLRIAPLDASAPLTLQVSGIVVSAGSDDPEHAFIVSVPTLQTLLCAGSDLGHCNVTADVYADVTDDAAGDDARAALVAAGFRETAAPANVSRLREVGPLPGLLAAFLYLLAAAGLLHQLTTTLRRRRTDLAVVRALGLPARRAAAALLWQALLMSAVGVVAGLTAGAVVGPLAWRIVAGGLGVEVVTHLPAAVVPIAAAAGALMALVVSIGPRWWAARLPLAATLRAE